MAWQEKQRMYIKTQESDIRHQTLSSRYSLLYLIATIFRLFLYRLIFLVL